MDSIQMIATTEFAFESLGPALRIVALIILFLIPIMGLILLIVVASLPGLVAARRDHPQTNVVRVAGWVGLPTGILWAIAMAWAYWNFDEQGRPSHPPEAGLAGLESHRADTVRQQVEHLEGLVKQLEQSKELK